jgi:hypothetical protein
MRASDDGFDYFVKDGKLFNIKKYFKSLIPSVDKIINTTDAISFHYKTMISEHCSMKSNQSNQSNLSLIFKFRRKFLTLGSCV